MSDFAIVKIGASQYKVSEGQELLVAKQKAEKGAKIALDQVLLVVNKSDVKLGQPFLPKTSIKATVVDQEKGIKVRVATYKAKARFRKVKGFRSQLTRIKIDKISLSK
jgi:large subunit ribosomal protein L21